MRLFEKSDRMFEAAARDRASSDRLLGQLRKARKFTFICIFSVAVPFLTVGVSLFVMIFRWLHSPQFPIQPPLLNWSTSHPHVIWIIGGGAVFITLLQVILMLNLDTQLKVLLLVRGQKEVGSSS